MYNIPFFGMPYYRNYYARNYYSNRKPQASYIKNEENINNQANLDNKDENLKKEQKNSTTNNNYSSTIFRNSRSSSEPFFNILGIELYSDDILILCILLSLYLEGVKDEMLFICLILLLLS